MCIYFRSKWYFLCVSVGDCKAFVCRGREVRDITAENRGNANNPTDPGKLKGMLFCIHGCM